MPTLSRKRGRPTNNVVQQNSASESIDTPPQRRRIAAPAVSQTNHRQPTQTQAQQLRHRGGDSSDEEEEDEEEEDEEEEEDGRSGGHVNRDRMVQKFVRLALASEFTRQPIKRIDISAKVLGTEHSRMFKAVFEETQNELRRVFGMELMELPVHEKVNLAQKRAAQRSERGPAVSSKSYILTTTLPEAFRVPEIIGAGSPLEKEQAYVGLVTTICTLIYLNGRSLPEAKLDRYLKRLNIEINNPVDKTEKLLATMTKQKYLNKVTDNSSGETAIEYHLGPRAKVEIGKSGVTSFLQEIYGIQAPEDLAERVKASIGVEQPENKPKKNEAPKAKRGNGRSRARRDEDEDEEEEAGFDGESE